VVDVLREAAADGRLTPEDLDERLGLALSARTFGELAPLTADLGDAPGRPGDLTAQAPDVIRINPRYGAAERTGSWLVPRRLKPRPKWSRVSLDFTGAVITHEALDIVMNMRGGALILVIGPGMTVEPTGYRSATAASASALTATPLRRSASGSTSAAGCVTARSKRADPHLGRPYRRRTLKANRLPRW
jgi:hypothetical protein